MPNHLYLVLRFSICFLFISSIDLKGSNALTRTWDDAYALAKAFTKQMSLEEKCNMTSGVKGICIGVIAPVPRLNFSGFCLADSPSGVANHVQFSTAFASGIQITATWDRDLFYRRAVAIGLEFKRKGVHYALGPTVNLARNALFGRNWEAFGADPYLTGENAYYYVQGVQDQGVVANVKHYICHEQESFVPDNSSNYETHGYSVNIDGKTMHEMYLWPFADSVAAGVASVMCAYNQINGTWACENENVLNGILKGELGFRGNVFSDWGATRSGIPSVLAGLDIDMPGGDNFMGIHLLPGVQNGSIPESRIDDMITRILAPYYLLGQDQNYPSINLNYDGMDDHYLLNRAIGTAGIILLKNVNNTLPFNVQTEKMYSIYGSAAGRKSDSLDPYHVPGIDGAIYQGGGSGYVHPTYFIDPLSTLLTRARDDHLQMQYVTNQDDYFNINRSLTDYNFKVGHCLVFINAWSQEGPDRQNLSAYHDGDKLVQTIASYCYSTIVIVNSVSHLNLEAWIDHPHVTAVIWAGLPTTEYGHAITNVLFGDYNPGGKLVFTIAKNDSDYGTNITRTYNSNYTEGVFLDYRHFEKYNITPRYHFGYGLSYTTFSFSTLIISNARQDSFYRQRPVSSYVNEKLLKFYEPVYAVTFTITNTGNVDGSEVAQLYLRFPQEAEQPSKILRGFERIYLEAGRSKTVTLPLTQRDISYWNVINQNWTVAHGDYTVFISTSANNADIQLEDSFHI